MTFRTTERRLIMYHVRIIGPLHIRFRPLFSNHNVRVSRLADHPVNSPSFFYKETIIIRYLLLPKRQPPFRTTFSKRNQ